MACLYWIVCHDIGTRFYSPSITMKFLLTLKFLYIDPLITNFFPYQLHNFHAFSTYHLHKCSSHCLHSSGTRLGWAVLLVIFMTPKIIVGAKVEIRPILMLDLPKLGPGSEWCHITYQQYACFLEDQRAKCPSRSLGNTPFRKISGSTF